MRRLGHLGILLILLVGVSFADDIAYLRNGFTIRHGKREAIGNKTRLYTSSGYVDVATADIEQIVPDDTPAPPSTPAPVAAAPTVAPVKSINDHLSEASQSSGIDRDFLESVIHHESGFNPKAVSPKGARGLMQLMPGTADQLGVKDSFDPGQNIQGGTAYLKQLLEMYHGDAQKALAAYNAGPHRVEQYKGVPPYRETRAYVTRIILEYNRKKLAEQTAAKLAKAKRKSATSHPASVKAKAASTQASSTATRPAQPGS